MKPPEPVSHLGFGKALADILDELTRPASLPPGELSLSFSRTQRIQRETLQMLLSYYERFGPVFAFRSLHRRIVAMIGPAANHFVTVSGAENFSWRKGMFGEQLTPLMGDGLITTDEEYHDRARRIMMPAFHRVRLDSAVEVMSQEAERALKSWAPGARIDIYEWMRELAMNIAMRALLGLDPHASEIGREAARLFERGLAYYDEDTWKTLLRGPGTPWSSMQAARRGLDTIIYAEIERRRGGVAAPGTGADDVFSMLLEARDEAGDGFTAKELRDQIMHLLFGGHDTTSSTLSFLVYELARNPQVLERVTDELDRVLAGRAPTTDQLLGELPYLSMVLDETLRLYPPVWFGPRLTVAPFEFGGYRIPAGIHVIHSSWVSHRLPEVFPNPEAFIPERFSPEARRHLPPGAYIPFGGGQRICIGKRFGQLAVKAVAATVLQRFRCELAPGFELRVAKVPTLSPEHGLPMTVSCRQAAPMRASVPS
jgi:cytochrome P450